MSYPRCYDSITQFKQWRLSATRANEPCTPCHDCSVSYKEDMSLRGRCYPVEVREQFTVHEKRAKLPEELLAPILQHVTTGDEL